MIVNNCSLSFIIMKKTILKYTYKIILTLVIIFSVCEFTGVQKNQYLENKIVSAAQPSAENQYIPENLDYSEVIKQIKMEEGVLEEEEPTGSFEDKEENEDLSLFHKDITNPASYMTFAKECVRDAMNTGDEAEKRHLVKKALNYYKEYLKYKEGDLEALLGAGAMATYLGREEDAKNILMEAYATYPKNPRVHKALGDYSFKFSNYNNAIEYYNLSLLSGNLKDYATNLVTAVCYEKLGDIEKAIAYFRVAQHLNPDSEIANQRLMMYEAMEKEGYRADSRMYDEADKPSEDEDIELETLILDSQQIK